MSHRLFIALGSNLGDRQAHLQAAAAALPPAVRVLAASPVYETEPWGYLDQPIFLNQVLQAESDLQPAGVLKRLKRIEQRLGREATFRNGPRVIDLDLLLYDDLLLDTPDLTIPHPRLHERAFVLAPLADLAPDLRHPRLGQTIAGLLAQVNASGVKRL